MPAQTYAKLLHSRFLLLALALSCATAVWLQSNNRLSSKYRTDIQPIEVALEQEYLDLEELNRESAYTSLDNPNGNDFPFLILECQRNRNIIRDLKMRCIEVEPQTGASRDIREIIVETIGLEQNMADTLNKKLLAQSRLLDIKHTLHNDDQRLSGHYTRSFIELLHKDMADEMAQRDAAQKQFNELAAQARHNFMRTRDLLDLNDEAIPASLKK